MNIFYTHSNPVAAANEHCIIHRNKMMIEYSQMLSAAHHLLDGAGAIDGICKPAYLHHPCTKWVASSLSHYEWLAIVARNLSFLYLNHREKPHGMQETVMRLYVNHPRNLLDKGWREPPLCMPEKFKKYGTPSECYQQYLLSKFDKWGWHRVEFKMGCTPYWVRVVHF